MLSKICNILSTLLILCLLLLAGLMWGPKLMGYQGYAVISGSMEPTIHVGSVVYDKETAFDEVEVGDVITYNLADDTKVTHRVVAIDDSAQTVTTKGDANDSEDASPVSAAQIAGVVVFNVPYLGYLSIYSKTPLAITAVCALLIIILVLNFLPEIFKKEEPKDPATLERPDENESTRED